MADERIYTPQESQMAQLADIIPAMDIVHSSLLSRFHLSPEAGQSVPEAGLSMAVDYFSVHSSLLSRFHLRIPRERLLY